MRAWLYCLTTAYGHARHRQRQRQRTRQYGVRLHQSALAPTSS
jgi:hypothetical protein